MVERGCPTIWRATSLPVYLWTLVWTGLMISSLIAVFERLEVAVEPLADDRIAGPLQESAAEAGPLQDGGHIQDGVLGAASVARVFGTQDLVGLEHAGARILRVGAGARQHVDVESLNFAGLAHGHARLVGELDGELLVEQAHLAVPAQGENFRRVADAHRVPLAQGAIRPQRLIS